MGYVLLIGRKLIVNGGEKVVTVEYVENFEDIDKIADKLLTEYDKENEVEYNFKKFSFIAKENNKIVGYLTGFSYYAEVTINNLVVEKECRGRGVGKKLINHVVRCFKDRGFNNINLVTNAFQAPVFYKNCGFTLEFVRENKSNPKLTKYFFIKYL